MIDVLISIVYGIVQAATEFFPVSSSGHLVLLHRFLPLSAGGDLAFDVALHLGTLAALISVFYRDVRGYSIAFFKSFTNWDVRNDPQQRLSWYLVVGTIPALVIGIVIGDVAESLLRSTFLVAFLLISVGLLFFPVEKLSKKNRSLEDLTLRDILWIGAAQALAFIPGVSRSGITLLTGFGRGLTREAAARYSFLLAIPVTFLAGIKGIIDLASAGITSQQLGVVAVGLVTSCVVGIAVIRFFLTFVRTRTLIPFAWYRIALGVAVLAWFFFVR